VEYVHFDCDADYAHACTQFLPINLYVHMVFTLCSYGLHSSGMLNSVAGYLSRTFRDCMFVRGELSYLAPLGSENISAPYFK